MTKQVRWHFAGDSLIVVNRTPPLPRELQIPLVSLLAELTDSRQAMEDFLEVWREYKFKSTTGPGEPLIGNHCEINIVGDRVHLYPLYDEQWDEIEDVWIPVAEVEDMFREYTAWAFGGS